MRVLEAEEAEEAAVLFEQLPASSSLRCIGTLMPVSSCVPSSLFSPLLTLCQQTQQSSSFLLLPPHVASPVCLMSL